MTDIVLKNLTKTWSTANAVRDVNLVVKSGSFTVLLGPSGCGKSTTLRMLAGLDTPTGGSILIGGEDVTRRGPAERKLSMVFQSYALFPHLSVRENILFGLKVRKEPADQYEARLKRVVDMLGLNGLTERKPGQLSGGQQQRVALARAIIAETRVCLMDEPLSNLDAKLRQEMRHEIRALQQALGITMVYVTHDQTEAMSMADQVVLMRGGSIEQDGEPASLYNQPESIFAATFIGTPPMNIFDSFTQPGVRTGVRPEQVRVASSGGHAATVAATEYFGADTILACDLQGEGAARRRVVARIPGRHQPAPGSPIRLVWDAACEHHFDARTERRIALSA
jgi:sn-glycerol 3-phosphate transport system ATP-binding protein